MTERPADLRNTAARGSLINGAFMVGLTMLTMVKGALLAGFLSTSEYGVWGLLFISLGTLLLLKQVGVGDKFVQQDEADQRVAFQKAFTVEVIASGIVLVALLAALPLFVWAYGEPDLLAPGLAICLVVPALALQAPLWIFYRDMRFARQRTLQAIDPILSFVVTVVLAVEGAGYWSLVIGALVGSWAAALVAVAASPHPLRLRYERGMLRDYFGFSWPIAIATLSGAITAQVSVAAGDAVLGLAGVGAITLASSFAVYAERADQIVTQTIYPAICAVRDRTDLLFESFTKTNRLALMWGIPFGIGLTLFAQDMVDYAIGEEWQPAVGLIMAFGAIAAANHLGFNWAAFYQARGETRPLAVVAGIAVTVFLLAALPGLILFDLDGYAVGMALAATAALVGRLHYLRKLFPGFRLLPHAARAMAPTAISAGTIALIRVLEGGGRSAGQAAFELGLYLAVTTVATLALERRLLGEMIGYLRHGSGAATAVRA
ncbi:MAG: oligosaccharide flippase family protein [Thermoleophilaceae bacterium]|nr:oligosaccharide flippase family protein [Thermoleophilaceae bacterium]